MHGFGFVSDIVAEPEPPGAVLFLSEPEPLHRGGSGSGSGTRQILVIYFFFSFSFHYPTLLDKSWILNIKMF